MEKASIWVVGDSTLAPFNDYLYYIPRVGYGEELSNYFSATTYNLAVSGASSKDFTTMKNYRTLLEGNDKVPALGNAEGQRFLILGFGHNDEKTEVFRYTNPNGDYRTEGSFAHSLYENYIRIAQERGVTPVICTPIARLTDTNTPDSYNSPGGHIIEEVRIGDTLYQGGDYVKSILNMVSQLQEEGKDIELIDLTAATIKENLAMGEDAQWIHSFTGAKKENEGLAATGLDQTHTNLFGAKLHAWMISTLSEKTAPKLYKYSLHKAKPTCQEFFGQSINNDYKVIEYKAPTKDQIQKAHWPKFTDSDGRVWTCSVFGDIDDASINDENFKVSIADKRITLSALNNKGKIAKKSDGIMFYYTQLPAGTRFTLKAKAKIESFLANDQVSFGLMVRDDLYVDRFVAMTMGDYVAAGMMNQGNIVNYGRKNGVFFGKLRDKTLSIEPGTSIEMEIVASNDGYALTFGDNTDTAGFDYALTSVDPEHIYAGFYAVRNCTIEFSDIHLETR
ncbi:MAG TPA: hypothetical protein DCP98_01935 [Sphaerochaeta sp.]|nr:hypothetical protein [Sphaerochaeta sp.]